MMDETFELVIISAINATVQKPKQLLLLEMMMPVSTIVVPASGYVTPYESLMMAIRSWRDNKRF